MNANIILLLTIIASFLYFFHVKKQKNKKRKQLVFIKNYEFPSAIEKKIKNKYPHLMDDDIEVIFSGLRDYFCFCHESKKQTVAMPSQAVDIAWHEFILFTKNYEQFCKKSIGRFLHHTPTEAMDSKTSAQESIKRAWHLACVNERINPTYPVNLPLIFAIDSLLNIEDGFIYSLNCQNSASPKQTNDYCAGHIGCSSGCGGVSDSGGGFFNSSESSSSGGDGGCGGD